MDSLFSILLMQPSVIKIRSSGSQHLGWSSLSAHENKLERKLDQASFSQACEWTCREAWINALHDTDLHHSAYTSMWCQVMHAFREILAQGQVVGPDSLTAP